MEIRIRSMNESDLSALAGVYCEVYRVFDVGERWEQSSAQNWLTHLYKRQPDLAFVAESEDHIIGGFITGLKPWWDGNYLSDGEIFVHPDYQSHGVGSRLLKVMLETAIEKYQASVWEPVTFADHEFPMRWYKSLGFEPITGLTILTGDLKEALKRLNAKQKAGD